MNDKTYIGRTFERCVEFVFKGIKPGNPYPTKITDDEYEEIYNDAEKLFKQLEDHYDGIESVTWTGSYVSSTSSDLLIDGKLTELKYIGGRHGSTWANTSINAVMDYGFPKAYNWYMKEYDVYDFLEDELGKKAISRKNSSPMGQKEASKIMKEKPEFCNELKEIEMEARSAFVYDVVEHFKENPEQFEKFCIDVATKSICGNKKMPDLLIEFNNNTKTANFITKEELMEMLGDKTIKYEKGQCQFFIGRFRLGFSWKNGVGLFNPVIRVYI